MTNLEQLLEEGHEHLQKARSLQKKQKKRLKMPYETEFDEKEKTFEELLKEDDEDEDTND